MAKDIITDEEWEFGDEEPHAEPRKPKRSVSGGGTGSGIKDYLIVALIAIIAVMGINNFIYARSGDPGFLGGSAGSAGSGGGGCCGSGGGDAAGALPNTELEQLAVNYYAESTGDQDVDSITAEVEDFGCHQEIYVYKDGQRVMRVGYGNGQVYEL